MKLKNDAILAIITGIVLTLWACAPKPVIVSVPEEVAVEDQLFQAAEAANLEVVFY